MEIGSRVGAILSIEKDAKEVYFLGYGEYKGDEVPTTAVGKLAEFAVMFGTKNPKILLDDGEVVWGCECWWSSEKETKEELEMLVKEGYKLIQADIRAVREEWKKE